MNKEKEILENITTELVMNLSTEFRVYDDILNIIMSNFKEGQGKEGPLSKFTLIFSNITGFITSALSGNVPKPLLDSVDSFLKPETTMELKNQKERLNKILQDSEKVSFDNDFCVPKITFSDVSTVEKLNTLMRRLCGFANEFRNTNKENIALVGVTIDEIFEVFNELKYSKLKSARHLLIAMSTMMKPYINGKIFNLHDIVNVFVKENSRKNEYTDMTKKAKNLPALVSVGRFRITDQCVTIKNELAQVVLNINDVRESKILIKSAKTCLTLDEFRSTVQCALILFVDLHDFTKVVFTKLRPILDNKQKGGKHVVVIDNVTGIKRRVKSSSLKKYTNHGWHVFKKGGEESSKPTIGQPWRFVIEDEIPDQIKNWHTVTHEMPDEIKTLITQNQNGRIVKDNISYRKYKDSVHVDIVINSITYTMYNTHNFVGFVKDGIDYLYNPNQHSLTMKLPNTEYDQGEKGMSYIFVNLNNQGILQVDIRKSLPTYKPDLQSWNGIVFTKQSEYKFMFMRDNIEYIIEYDSTPPYEKHLSIKPILPAQSFETDSRAPVSPMYYPDPHIYYLSSTTQYDEGVCFDACCGCCIAICNANI